jgi:hypothetical protein
VRVAPVKTWADDLTFALSGCAAESFETFLAHRFAELSLAAASAVAGNIPG